MSAFWGTCGRRFERDPAARDLGWALDQAFSLAPSHFLDSAMLRVMISYRRSDSAAIAGRIFDRLAAHFGPHSVFMDVDAIPFGVDFQKYIDGALKTIDYVVAIVGPKWVGPLSGGTMRIDDPSDPVRLELEAALKSDVKIMPVLVEGAKMPPRNSLPQSLANIAFLNAPVIDSGIDFQVHVDRLIRSLEGSVRSAQATGGYSSERSLGNLPLRLGPLIGRANDVVAIESLLGKGPLVTVTGAGGVGKTRIALAVASNLRGAFLDGVWFVDLAQLRSAGFVPSTISGALGIKPAPDRAALETLVDNLRKRALLLVIDNCEHLVDEVASSLDALMKACPEVHVLATSREPLDIESERVYRLPSLSVAPNNADLTASAALEFGAIALFAERAASVNPDFSLRDDNASIVGDICRRLDGIALAIELAAARANVVGLREIRDRLDERFRILTQGRRTALPRQQTMRATIDWSYDLLDERKRRLFRRLAAFPNGFSLDGARAVGCRDGLDELDVVDDLGSLVSKSLVQAEALGGALRYRLLESTRQYALEKLAESMEAEAVKRWFSECCFAFVERAHALWETLPSKPWFDEVKPELENLREALKWSLEDRNDVALGQRIAAGARRMWGRVAPAEGKTWLRTAEVLIDEATPRELIASLCLCGAQVHIALQEYKPALDAAQRARQSYECPDGTLGYWEASGFAGCALAMLGRGIEAEPLLTETLAAYRQTGARQLIGGALNDLAFCYLMREDAVAARILFEEALELFREIGNGTAMASVAINLAEIEFQIGNVEAAIGYGETALSGSGDDRVSIAIVNMAAYLVAAGRWEHARERGRECISRVGIARTEMDTAFALQHLAAVAALRPARDDARSGETYIRAARLLGFVDTRVATLEFDRQFTERQEYERIVAALTDVLGQSKYFELRAEGSLWSEPQAISEAKLV